MLGKLERRKKKETIQINCKTFEKIKFKNRIKINALIVDEALITFE